MQMIKSINEKGCMTGNQLKILAAIAMTVDHLGAYIFTDIYILRVIGRLAFPIFAFMIAEGCQYTKNPKKYLLLMAGLAAVYQLVYFGVTHSLYQCILVTFSLSIAFIFTIKNYINRRTFLNGVLVIGTLIAVYGITEILPKVKSGFSVDYGFCGVLVPVFVFLGKEKSDKLFMAFCGLFMLSAIKGGVQWYSLFTILLLAMYNGKRGRMKMKSFFYIYYPLHLAIIYLIGEFLLKI